MDPLRKDDVERGGTPRKAWSIHEASPLLRGQSERRSNSDSVKQERSDKGSSDKHTLVPRDSSREGRSQGNFILYVIYAIVNVIIAVPGLYGASVGCNM